MSAMTRLRMSPGSEAPRELNSLYYEQRASAGGLLVSECIYSDPTGRGYVRAPGLHTQEQLSGWKQVVDRVHAKGGYLYAQLFHAGRISHPSLLPGGQQTLSASSVKPTGQLYVEGGVKKEYETPRALELSDIPPLVFQFAKTAKAAVEQCGFDGIEIHAGNGYLLHQFLAAQTNQRSDKYGGSVENRSRLLLEVVDACAAEIGPERVGVKLQPGLTFADLVQPEVEVRESLSHLGPELSKRGLAYVCLSSLNGEPYYKLLGLQAPHVGFDVFERFRERYTGTLMINGGLSVESAESYISRGKADLASFGVPFIANPRLPALVAEGKRSADLNPAGWNTGIWYSKDPSKDAAGYTEFE
eukprot:CAMPEP_0202922876 /NCGR_PEP_ID=MMETSP1392-20130828/78154_1 /ASSEMBLY_ACC=CAM_ASM_000868 /TAXON_ID=225041 /ORGANISM="Chlamydomonas chlamydogama, Strain SAG 11-48b" /LENGTH=357 /DNA_ID=CAMNT_0049616529 /DNA_START=311 /DNA_END=1384 /DNA_ORIENTATION=-